MHTFLVLDFHLLIPSFLKLFSSPSVILSCCPWMSVIRCLHAPSPSFSLCHHLFFSPSVIHLLFILILCSKVIFLLCIISVFKLFCLFCFYQYFTSVSFLLFIIPFFISLAFFLYLTASHMRYL